MTNYYYDCEFLEGKQKTWFGETKPTIDLISIGIISMTGNLEREYYAVSKDFNLKEAWNRYDLEPVQNTSMPQKKNYWIRYNVLKPIFDELLSRAVNDRNFNHSKIHVGFEYKNLKYLINYYGKHNNVIANDICTFIYGDDCGGSGMSAIEMACKYETNDKNLDPCFYGYYSAYDHVALCWLFGKMKDLPKGFPMYTRDLKQMLDEKAEQMVSHENNTMGFNLRLMLTDIECRPGYPKQDNAHHALDDARWNMHLHEFIKTL